MSKNKALKIVNIILLILLINQFLTGIFGMELPYAVFQWCHKRAAYVLLAVAAVHLVLNWNWVKANYYKK